MDTPRIDGYVVDRLVGFGSTGRVWRAQVEASGEWVALKRLRPEAIAVLERLQREAAAVSATGSQHLVRVRSVLRVEAEVFVVSDFVSGDSLETLLARRDRLSAPELVTVLGPTATALGDLHAAGLVHGAVSPPNLLIAPDGRPMLTDCGVGLALDGGSADPAGDVQALAELGLAAIDEEQGPLAALLASVVGSQPSPTAREFAASVLAAGPAAPIRVASVRRPPVSAPLIPDRPIAPPRRPATVSQGPVRRLPVGRPKPVEQPPRRPRISRAKLLTGAAVAVLIAGAAVTLKPRVDRDPLGRIAVNSRTTPTATATPAPGASTHSPDWLRIVRQLETTRARAFVRADQSLLTQVYARTSAELMRDRKTIAGFEKRGLHAAGFTASVVAVGSLSATTSTANLEVSDRLSAYSLVDRDGALIGHGTARSTRTYLMTLTRTPAGWRVQNLALLEH